MSKLALGTVQFGLKYGVGNRFGVPSETETAAILILARRGGVDTLDTAVSYGDCEARLGALGLHGWRIITKIPALPEGTFDPRTWLEDQVRESQRRLCVKRLDAVLLHHAADACGVAGSSVLGALRALKEAGLVSAIGVSIYDPIELDSLWPVWIPDIVQAPFNVLDRRLVRSGWLKRLSDAGVRVHARSVFLQGLLLMDAKERPASFDRWGRLLDRWAGWCTAQGHPQLDAALGFVCAQAEIERVVVGVETAAQLGQILQASSRVVALPPDDMMSDDRELLEPYRWRVK